MIDVAVIGAGPAGANAALKAAEYGLQVVLLDEQEAAGGQVWRAKSKAVLSAPMTPEGRAGDALRASVAASDVEFRGDCRVWAVERHADVWRLRCLRGAGVETIETRALVLACGAREIVQPVPGWTLPGVIGLAGATALMKRELVPPGKRVVVSGTGPLVFFVAHEVRRLGGEVSAVVTPNARRDWLAALPSMLGRVDLAGRGALWIVDLMLAGVPVYWRHTVSSVLGDSAVSGVQVQPVDADWALSGAAREIAADAVCMGHGLEPNGEAAELAGAGERLFECGDGAGILGAAAAEIDGAIAGLNAAQALGVDGLEAERAALTRRHGRAVRFGAAMTTLSIPRDGQMSWTNTETLLCRCEGITRAAFEAEVLAGAETLGTTKSGTRCGMGPCGGRYCQVVAGRLLKAMGHDAPPATARPPLRPVPIGAMAEGFEYDDLPIPKPAPL